MIHTNTELYAIRRIWNSIAEDNEFPSFEGFVEWAEGKYRRGFAIYKLRECKPHSPENSYWYFKQKTPEDIESPFCAGCTVTMRACRDYGCQKYRKAYVKNWNENIRREQEIVTIKPMKREFFRYEHPDMVREGIVFEHAT